MNAVTIDYRSGVGIAAALCGVVFSQSELKVCVRLFFSVESDAIQRNAFRIDLIVLQRAQQQVEGGVFV
jgi:hypothetical protein